MSRSALVSKLLSRTIPVAVAVLIPSGLAAQPSPRVTSEISCDHDSDCPAHDGLCFNSALPTCGCDEGAGHCDPNPLACDSASDCFGEEVCVSGHCAEPGPRENAHCNFDEDCTDWMSCQNGGCTRGECTLTRDCDRGEECDGNECGPASCQENRDCPAGFACRNRECQPVQCVADADCGDPFQVCRSGACQVVECTATAQCGGCELCDSSNRCQTRCDRGEGCRRLWVTEFPFSVESCVACTPDANGDCPTIQFGCRGSQRLCDAIKELEKAIELSGLPQRPGR